MLDYLLATCLLLLTIGHALLVWGCLDWRNHRHALNGEMSERADGFTSLITDLGSVLEDIADILDSGSGGDTGNMLQAPIPGMGENIGEMLSSALMNRVMQGFQHGTEQSGQIQESISKAQNEIGNQPDEHG